jgi:ubiquinol-cytochrome c reductase cytochrome b subunit
VKPSQRLRARLARGMYGPDTQIPKPTAEEYREITSGDHH